MKKNEALFRFMKFGYYFMSPDYKVTVQLVLFQNGGCQVDNLVFGTIQDFYEQVISAADCCDRLMVSYTLDHVRYEKIVDLCNTHSYSNVSLWSSLVKPLIF